MAGSFRNATAELGTGRPYGRRHHRRHALPHPDNVGHLRGTEPGHEYARITQPAVRPQNRCHAFRAGKRHLRTDRTPAGRPQSYNANADLEPPRRPAPCMMKSAMRSRTAIPSTSPSPSSLLMPYSVCSRTSAVIMPMRPSRLSRLITSTKNHCRRARAFWNCFTYSGGVGPGNKPSYV